jgi:hypothetical protein
MTWPSFVRWKPNRDSVGTTTELSRPVSRPAPAPSPVVTGPARPPHLLTMATAIRPGGQILVRRFFDGARWIKAFSEPLRDLGLIRAAHWTVIDALPDGRGGSERLQPPYLLFESTYDVGLTEYIDLFARKLPLQMRAVWGTGCGYPGVLPASAFRRWVDEHKFCEDHEWRAYPEATTRMVASGLRVVERLRAFDARVAGVDNNEFAFEFRRLLVELQEDLS